MAAHHHPAAMGDTPTITALLEQASRGDRAAFDQAFALVYEQLGRVASRRLRHEGVGHTLDTGALVHEAYLKLGEQADAQWTNRAHFLAVASTAMRRVLVDHARRRTAEKRGGPRVRVPLEELVGMAGETPDDTLLALDEALDRLGAFDARHVQVVECRFFGGLTEEETASALGIGLRTVKRDWAKTRAWLFRELHADHGD